MIYVDHDGLRTDAEMGDPEWMELMQERQESACRQYGRGAAFVVEATHTSERAYEAVATIKLES